MCKSGSVNLFCGTVFKMKHNAGRVFTEAPIHRFKGANSDGTNPYAALCCDSGILYGTTLHGGTSTCTGSGCGTVIQYTLPNGPEIVRYSFTGSTIPTYDGANP